MSPDESIQAQPRTLLVARKPDAGNTYTVDDHFLLRAMQTAATCKPGNMANLGDTAVSLSAINPTAGNALCVWKFRARGGPGNYTDTAVCTLNQADDGLPVELMAFDLKIAADPPSTTSRPASAHRLVGDKWSLLIVRDVGLFGKHRNKDFQEAAEGVPTNILANRLKRLVDQGLLERRLYQQRPPRHEYHLTEAGQALLPVIGELARWARERVDGVDLDLP